MARNRKNETDWTEKLIETLRALWGEGHTAAEIGRRMNLSKNMIVGKAKRIGLVGRPSPIRKRDPNKPKMPGGAAAVTFAARQAAALEATAPKDPIIIKPAPVKIAKTMKPQPCSFPIGEPKKPSFHFCNEPTQPGSSYCPTHHSICWRSARDAADRNRDAA